MTMHAQASDDDVATAADILGHLRTTLPAWLPYADSTEIREWRRIVAVAGGLQKNRRDYRWVIRINTLTKDFEKLRATVYKRSGH